MQMQGRHGPARPPVWLVVAVVLSCGAGCSPPASDTSGLQADLTLSPSPPVVGDAEISLKLTGADGAPLKGADVSVEGNMNHAGMTPSMADLQEGQPGTYSGTLEFTMGGDWFLLVTAQTADGKTMQTKIDVPGVKSP